MKCVLCGSADLELRDFSSRDFRGQNITVKICADSRACIDRAIARRPLTKREIRDARAAR